MSRGTPFFGKFLELVPNDPEIQDILQDDSRLVKTLP